MAPQMRPRTRAQRNTAERSTPNRNARPTTRIRGTALNRNNRAAINEARPQAVNQAPNNRSTHGTNGRRLILYLNGVRGAIGEAPITQRRFFAYWNGHSIIEGDADFLLRYPQLTYHGTDFRLGGMSRERITNALNLLQSILDNDFSSANSSNENAYNDAVNEYIAQREARTQQINSDGLSTNATSLESQNPLMCNICLNPYKNREPTAIECGHIYCRECIERHIENKNAVCVACNAVISRRLIHLFP